MPMTGAQITFTSYEGDLAYIKAFDEYTHWMNELLRHTNDTAKQVVEMKEALQVFILSQKEEAEISWKKHRGSQNAINSGTL